MFASMKSAHPIRRRAPAELIAGIGVGWSFMGSKAVLIFDPSTYTLLGVTSWGEQGQVGGAALLQMAITNQAGQKP
jgi:hypothetical protein